MFLQWPLFKFKADFSFGQIESNEASFKKIFDLRNHWLATAENFILDLLKHPTLPTSPGTSIQFYKSLLQNSKCFCERFSV